MTYYLNAGRAGLSTPWSALGKEFVDRLATLLADVIARIDADFVRDMRLFLVDSRNTLVPAAPGGTGRSGDWINDIHPTSDGHRKLAAEWRGVVDPVFQ